MTFFILVRHCLTSPANLAWFTPETNAERLQQILGEEWKDNDSYIDLFAPLQVAKDSEEDLLYHQLDSHWNAKGAFAAYLVLMQFMGLEPVTEEVPDVPVQDFQGDLAAMYYPDRITLDRNFRHELFQPEFTPLRPIRTWEDIRIETRSSGKGDTLLMYRDSFANALIPYLSSTFEEAVYMRGEAIDLRAVQQHSADLVLVEMAERNISRFLQKTPVMPAPAAATPAVDSIEELDLDLFLKLAKEPERGDNQVRGDGLGRGINPEQVSDLKPETLKPETKKRYNMFHCNLRLPEALEFSDCLVASGGEFYRAFPIYEDNDVSDGQYQSGLSLSTPRELSDPVFYLKVGDSWLQLPLG